MGSVVSVLFGAGVGVAIVLGCWQLATFADALYHQARDEPLHILGPGIRSDRL